MSDRGKFSGFNWHFEYHSVNPKKEKAADCIFLTTERTCQNKESYHYLAKCFVASDCPLRVKSKDAEEYAKKNAEKPAHTPKKELYIKKIKCSLPMNCEMYSSKYGEGRLVDYNEESMIISVQFEEKIIRFQYPKAILDEYLIIPEYAFESVVYDVLHAERG